MGENETLRFIWLHMVHSIARVMLKQQFFEIETNTQFFFKQTHCHSWKVVWFQFDYALLRL